MRRIKPGKSRYFGPCSWTSIMGCCIHLLSAAVAASALSACASRSQNSSDDSAAVLAAMDAYKTSIEKGDVAGIEAAYYSPAETAFSYFPEGAGMRGADILKNYREWFTECAPIRLTYRDLRTHLSASGDVALVTYLEDATEGNGKPRSCSWTNRRATVMWEKQERKWRIVHAHWSDSAAPDAATK